MKKNLWLLILIIISTYFLQAQYDELKILLNQAKNYENRNQFTKALEIYSDLYNKYPDNENVIDPYLKVLYKNSDINTAELILSDIQDKVTPYFYQKQNILLLIKQNNPDQAEKTALDWLEKYPGQIQYYQDIANIFISSSLIDTAVKIYLKARNITKDNDLYSLELSNAYFFLKNAELFFNESLKHLRKNPGYLYFYKNRFIQLLDEDNSRIKLITDNINLDTDPEPVIELYAFALVSIKDFETANIVYEKLPIDKITKFADDLLSDGYTDYALSTYLKAINRAELDDKPEKLIIIADIKIKIANIYFEQKEINNAINLLSEIINEQTIQKSPWHYRTKANKEARLLMALISIQENADKQTISDWFDQAAKFAYNQLERSEIMFQLSRYLYLTENYQEANTVIQNTIKAQDMSSNIYKMSYFYKYDLSLFQNSPAKDSLLIECIIHFPEDKRINDILFRETFINNLNKEAKQKFLNILKIKGLYRDEEATEALFNLAIELKNDELFILALEWMNSTGLYHKLSENISIDIEDYQLSNQALKDYYFLLKAKNIKETDYRKRILQDFLDNNPNNTFSPQFRLLLYQTKKQEG
jgi:CRISPR/Cas system-associated protein endoribonuclease Cas2